MSSNSNYDTEKRIKNPSNKKDKFIFNEEQFIICPICKSRIYLDDNEEPEICVCGYDPLDN